MAKPQYVSLHTHSDYSLLDGLGKVGQYLELAKELGMPAMALTDHGVLYGAIDFYKQAKTLGIKPIIGVEAYIAPRTRFDKVAKIDSKYTHLTLLARNNQGYRNLIELVTASWMEGFYYKPRIDRDLLAEKADGLIILTGCANSEVVKAINANNIEDAERTIQFYQEIVGKDHVFLEIQDHPGLPEQGVANKGLIELSHKHQWPLVITNDCHYVRHSDKDAHEVLLAVQSKSVDEDKRWSLKEVDLYLRPAEEFAKAFPDHPEALENTLRVAELCDISIEFGGNHLPEFPSNTGLTNADELRAMCEKGLSERYGDDFPADYRERMNFELDVINTMGFASYFLIVADYVNWAKENKILVGPGRGSAAGSLVAYLTGITELDPMKYGLLFERFLNPDRISMPDIDTDFADSDRARVLQYVREKYGDDHVAGIITFGTMAARAAVRDTGRALGMSYQDVDRVAKLVPPPKQGKHVPLKKLLDEAPDLRKAYDTEPQTKQLLDLASQLEGTYRHAGQHASAFVISKEPLTHIVPLQPAQKGDVAHVTQFSMYPVDELGLLKMDFLGLSNLSIIQRTLEIIEAAYNEKIDIQKIPMDDTAAYELLSRGDTTGVFQLESGGMKRYLRDLKPSVFDDIIAMVALYRPGPLGAGLVDSFIRRKHGEEEVSYMHPLTKNALSSTYGIPVYQEQVMQVSKDMAGFTSGEADTLRKAMGKKIAKLMAEMRDKFIQGSVKNNVERSIAEAIFTQFEEFAAYGFNKSHAACYALIAYQTAYLKAHYPSAFMAALMTSDHDDTDRLAIEIEETKRMGKDVLQPDVNESFVDFGVVPETGNIRYGLAGIKNIGDGIAKAIVRERKAQGPYTSLLNFVTRLGSENINKKVLENLAKAGALDQLAERNQVLQGLDQILKLVSAQQKAAASAQIGLFDVGGPIANIEPTLDLPAVEEASKRQKLAWEKELLGMYLSSHPLQDMRELLNKCAYPIGKLTEKDVDKRVRIGGVIISTKQITTKNKSNMLFGTIEDLSSSCEFVAFPRTLEEYKDLMQPDTIVLIEGRVSSRDGELKIAADKLWRLDEDFNLELLPEIMQSSGRGRRNSSYQRPDQPTQRVFNSKQTPEKPRRYSLLVTLPSGTTKNVLEKMKQLLGKYPGDTPVILRLKQNGSFQEITTRSAVNLAQPIEAELGLLLGSANITLTELE